MTTKKINYAASATLSNAVTSLATSSTFVAGYESATIDNSSNLYVDIAVGGNYRVGTSPTTATNILIYVIPMRDDGGTWPDVFDGTESAETVTSAGVLRAFGRLAAIIDVDSTTSDRDYPFFFTLAQLFGGTVPQKSVLFTTHNTGVNFNSTGGNHVTKTTGIYYTDA